MIFWTCVNETAQDKVASTAADFLRFALRGTARPSFSARIEGAHSDRAASASKKTVWRLPYFRACSLSLQGWGLIDLPLRASNEHILIMRVPRAQKIISLHPLPLLSRYRPLVHTALLWIRSPHLPVRLSRSGTNLCWRLRRRSPFTATCTHFFEISPSAFPEWCM